MWLCDIINYKRVQTSSAMSTHIHCFWDGLKKPVQNHHEQNQSVGPWCLSHRCRRVADSDASWCDWSSASQPVPSRMQLCKAALRFHKRLPPQHLLTLEPSPPHLSPFIATLPIVSQIDVNDRAIWLQGCGQGLTMKCIQSNPILMPAGKA